MAVLLPALIGCGVDRGSDAVRSQQATMTAAQEEPAVETYALGTEVTPIGAVAESSTGDNFVRGGEVYLSVDVSGASTEQKVEVRWVDPHGKVIRTDERQAAQGTRYVPFSSGRTANWKPGAHRAVIVIDGRRVSEKSFALL